VGHVKPKAAAKFLMGLTQKINAAAAARRSYFNNKKAAAATA